MDNTPPALPGPRPPPLLRAELSGDLDQLAQLRQQCAALLARLPDRVIGDVQLVVSELVSNVLRHTPHHTGQIEVRHEATRIRVEVSDPSSVPPQLLRDAPVGGRGIHIVDAVASTWGVTRQRLGKTVWVDIGISP